jgi:hypothetical protein
MRYILIYSTGKVLTFSVLQCAAIFQQAYGGTLITQELTVQESVTV